MAIRNPHTRRAYVRAAGEFLDPAAEGTAEIVLEGIQEMFLKLALQVARDDYDYEARRERQRQGIELAKAAGKYAGRRPNQALHQRIITLRKNGMSIKATAKALGCSESHVKPIWSLHRASIKA